MVANIPGRNRAVFLLTYEELLQRRLGRYEHVTSLRPLQLVSRLSLDITVVDHAAITDLQVLPLQNSRSAGTSSSARSNILGLQTHGLHIVYCFHCLAHTHYCSCTS